jgi:hypothetical protein
MSAIVDPATETSFRWESWKTGRKHRVAVYGYVVDVAFSHYHLVAGSGSHTHQAIVGYHGVLEVDGETGEVLHFTYAADRLPKDLMLTTVDYAFSDVGGQDYLLPARSVAELRGSGVTANNEIVFRDYPKFAADSAIDFLIAK